MIAVDTSALVAILLNEPEAGRCLGALAGESLVLISAGTVAEALIVSIRFDGQAQMSRLLSQAAFRIEPVTPRSAEQTAEAHRAWGKGRHPASLNFGDCFAYALAKEHGCPLLYVGRDFSRTDIQSVP